VDIQVLINIFVFLAAACVVVPLAARFKLGAVLGYLIAGIVIGPFGLKFIQDTESVMHFAEFGVVMMLFLIGLELEPAVLWRLRKTIVGLGGLQVILTSLTLTFVGMGFGLNWQTALAIGMALSMSSTALVLQMLEERNLMHSQAGETSFSVLLFQDIAVIPILLMIPLLALSGVAPGVVEAAHGAGGHTKSANLLTDFPGWVQALGALGVIGLVILAGRYLSHHLFYQIARSKLREVFTATSLMIVVGITVLMSLVGISPALGAFLGGVVLANSQYKHTIETDIEPFKGLLLGLFFISVGMGMDFNILAANPLNLIICVLGLMLIKGLILFGLGRIFGLKGPQSLGFAFGLSQGGEFAFVLFQMSGGLGLLPSDLQKFLTLVVAMSIALTPLFIMGFERFIIPRFASRVPEQPYDEIDEQNAVIIAGFGRFGQIVGRFMMHQDVKVTILEKNPDQIELLRRFDLKGYFGDATRLDLLRNAGAAQAKLLVIAIDDADDAVKIVKMVKVHFPKLKIYARARNRRHAYELDKAGVDYYHRETLDSSLALAREAMIGLGYSKSQMEAKAKRFLAHDILSLKKSFAFFDSEVDLVSFAKLSRQELEQILRDDVQDN
jgi:monovalent cation:proton antiporter-2 (CPA2) family protein